MGSSQIDFLSGYIEALFTQLGFNDLSEEQKNVYIPRFTALLEEKIGIELLPQLDDAQLDRFVELIDKRELSDAKTWSEFWHGAITNFDEKVGNILKEFTLTATSLV